MFKTNNNKWMILFYCLIWTFNTFLFYKKVLKPKLNL